MDATTRWETEALRDGPAGRPSPPRPTAKRRSDDGGHRAIRSGAWVTLREAEAATGIPVSTLRKWVRRAGLDSYLESDGENPVRMVDLGAVQRRAEQLGRDVAPLDRGAAESSPEPRGPSTQQDEAAVLTANEVADEPHGSTPDANDAQTMLVPVDAWNKMLNQLGNLHEAGQQLAEARERAAKAETEAAFLRNRLAELRETEGDRPEAIESDRPDPVVTGGSEDSADERPTTSFLRYMTVGWRQRRRG